MSVFGEHPYNFGRWPGQTAPLIDNRQLNLARANFNALHRAHMKRRPGRRKKT